MKGDIFLRIFCFGSVLANIVLALVIWSLVTKPSPPPAVVKVPVWTDGAGGPQDPIDYSKTGLSDDKWKLDPIELDVPPEIKEAGGNAPGPSEPESR